MGHPAREARYAVPTRGFGALGPPGRPICSEFSSDGSLDVIVRGGGRHYMEQAATTSSVSLTSEPSGARALF